MSTLVCTVILSMIVLYDATAVGPLDHVSMMSTEHVLVIAVALCWLMYSTTLNIHAHPGMTCLIILVGLLG